MNVITGALRGRRALPALVAVLLALVVVAPAHAIMGGEQAPDGSYRFMASIQTNGSHGTEGHFCGGSIVAQHWILTAAHCAVDEKPGDLQVVVGRTDLTAKGGQVLRVDRVLVHPRYASTGTFDAALLHTIGAVKSPSIALAPVGNDVLESDGAALTVTGWGGEFFESPSTPPHLKRLDVQAVSDSGCQSNGPMGFRPRSEMCAQTLGGDACQGDSGGPLFGRLPSGRRVQVGIVSYGLGCGTPGFPGVYAEVNNRAIHRFVVRHLR